MTSTYSLLFVNQSANAGNACVYQYDPNLGVPNAMSLAWFSKFANPNTNILFKWAVDYSFVWDETGTLKPGVIFSPSQMRPADLSTANQITLNYNGAFEFINQGPGPQAGSLSIQEGGNIPPNLASVGIGMSGSPIYAVQAQPNFQSIFTPYPNYWIAFGNYMQGEVLDVENIMNPAQISFPPGAYSMTAILRPDNTWEVEPIS